MNANARRMVRRDFELFFEREDWFRQHHLLLLPYRRGYLLWGAPGNGKTATIRVMAAHPYIRPYTVDFSDSEEKSADVLRLFEKAGENTPALVILEDLDRAFPTEGNRRQEKDGELPDLAQLPRRGGIAGRGDRGRHRQRPHLSRPRDPEAPGRFDRVVQFRNPNTDLRREYYQRLSPVLTRDQFEIAIE